MTQISRSFVNGPMISGSCREHLLELMDLLQLYTSMEEETDYKEGFLLTNAVISTCDSMLRTYDPQRHSYSDQLPIDSPVFYHIYGSSLLSLLFRAISSYLSEISNILEEHDGTKTSVKQEYQERVVPLRKYQKILVETAMEYCKESYQKSIACAANILMPNEQERSESDPGAFEIFDVLGSTVANRELFFESLLAECFVNRREMYIPDILSRVSEFEPSICKDLVNEIILSKSSYFIQNSIFYIQVELKWAVNFEICASTPTVSSMLDNEDIAPCEPNWALDFESDSEEDSDQSNDSEEDSDQSNDFEEDSDQSNDFDEDSDESNDFEEDITNCKSDDGSNESNSANESPLEDDPELTINEDLQETESCVRDENELIQDFESIVNIKQQCFTDASKAIGLDRLYLSICALKGLLSFADQNSAN